MQATVDDS